MIESFSLAGLLFLSMILENNFHSDSGQWLPFLVATHIESRAPIVLEGDFILPMLATSFSESSIQSQVRTLFLYEESEEQFRHNFLQREPEHGLQEKRAQVSWLYGQWLRREAERVGALTVPARPWSDLFERILIALK